MTGAELEKYPAWRNALVSFRQAKFPYGHIVTHEWLFEAFGLTMPQAETPWAKAKQAQLEYMTNVIHLREVLQLEDLLYLETEHTVGYRIVAPSEQTAHAMAVASRRVLKALKSAARAVSYIRQDELTDQQRRENMDARAKISSVTGLTKRIVAPF